MHLNNVFACSTKHKEKTMKASWSWKTITGWVVHGLIGGIMLLAGSAKVLGLFPPEQVEKLGLSVPIQVIGAGELVTALLLLIPRTASLGVLLTSGFWGGAICLHLSKGEPFVLQSVFLVLSWVGAYLRVPGTFASFAGSSAAEPPIVNATKTRVA
jgi:hypothetical protein